MNISEYFKSNEECAAALYKYLIEHKHISAKDPFVQENNILHDINNLRGQEWLELLPRNAETEVFFACLDPEYVAQFYGCGAELEDTFIFDNSIYPGEYWELATGESGVIIATLDVLREKMDKAGLGDVWDYPMADITEAVANNEHLVLVEDPSTSTVERRVFEVTEEMYERYEKMYGQAHGINEVDEMKAEVLHLFDSMQDMKKGESYWIASDMVYMMHEAKGNAVDNFGVEEAYLLASKLNYAMTCWFTAPISRGEYVCAVCDLIENGISEHNNSHFDALDAERTLNLLLNGDEAVFGILVESTAVQNCYRYLPEEYKLNEEEIAEVERAIEGVGKGIVNVIENAKKRSEVLNTNVESKNDVEIEKA